MFANVLYPRWIDIRLNKLSRCFKEPSTRRFYSDINLFTTSIQSLQWSSCHPTFLCINIRHRVQWIFYRNDSYNHLNCYWRENPLPTNIIVLSECKNKLFSKAEWPQRGAVIDTEGSDDSCKNLILLMVSVTNPEGHIVPWLPFAVAPHVPLAQLQFQINQW